MKPASVTGNPCAIDAQAELGKVLYDLEKGETSNEKRDSGFKFWNEQLTKTRLPGRFAESMVTRVE